MSCRPDESLADARDHALLLIGWKAALRSDDLARLQMDDLHSSEQGLSVFIGRSKTDQAGHGTTLGIAAPSSDTTTRSTLFEAGAAWVRWRDLLCSHGILDGPAWRGIDRYGRRPRTGGLHRNSVAGIIKRRAAAAGLEDAELWDGHSLRRGFATEAIAAGVPERDVQRHGRWRSRASMDPYIDAARTFDPTNPTRWLSRRGRKRVRAAGLGRPRVTMDAGPLMRPRAPSHGRVGRVRAPSSRAFGSTDLDTDDKVVVVQPAPDPADHVGPDAVAIATDVEQAPARGREAAP